MPVPTMSEVGAVFELFLIMKIEIAVLVPLYFESRFDDGRWIVADIVIEHDRVGCEIRTIHGLLKAAIVAEPTTNEVQEIEIDSSGSSG